MWENMVKHVCSEIHPSLIAVLYTVLLWGSAEVYLQHTLGGGRKHTLDSLLVHHRAH